MQENPNAQIFREPLSFEEFLRLEGTGDLVDYLSSIDSFESIPKPYEDYLWERLRFYYIIGGEPEAVDAWNRTRNFQSVRKAQRKLIHDCEKSFLDYPNPDHIDKVHQVFDSIPHELNRERKKFIVSLIGKGHEERTLREIIDWLEDQGVVRKVPRMLAPKLDTLSENHHSFKLFLPDVGLLTCQSERDLGDFWKAPLLFTTNYGAFAENFLLTSLEKQFDSHPRYWLQSEPYYEARLVFEDEGKLLPVDISLKDSSRGLRHFRQDFPDEADLYVCYSPEPLSFNGRDLNIPLYMADQTKRLVDLARKEQAKKA